MTWAAATAAGALVALVDSQVASTALAITAEQHDIVLVVLAFVTHSAHWIGYIRIAYFSQVDIMSFPSLSHPIPLILGPKVT